MNLLINVLTLGCENFYEIVTSFSVFVHNYQVVHDVELVVLLYLPKGYIDTQLSLLQITEMFTPDEHCQLC